MRKRKFFGRIKEIVLLLDWKSVCIFAKVRHLSSALQSSHDHSFKAGYRVAVGCTRFSVPDILWWVSSSWLCIFSVLICFSPFAQSLLETKFNRAAGCRSEMLQVIARWSLVARNWPGDQIPFLRMEVSPRCLNQTDLFRAKTQFVLWMPQAAVPCVYHVPLRNGKTYLLFPSQSRCKFVALYGVCIYCWNLYRILLYFYLCL